MNGEVARQMARSSHDFLEVVWPIVRGWCKRGEVVPVESVTASGFIKKLDTLAGIDLWQICEDESVMRGIASRVSYVDPGGRVYETFTIRYGIGSGRDTEFDKRRKALADPGSGWLFPALTVQANVEQGTGRLLSVAMVKTMDLIGYAVDEFLRPGHEPVIRTNRRDGHRFIVVGWRELEITGVRVKVWRANVQLGNAGR